MVPSDTTLELSRAEIVAHIDREAQRRLGMSAKDMLRAYREGRLRDCGKVADLLALANLLDPADPLFAAA